VQLVVARDAAPVVRRCFWPILNFACTQTAISQLPIKILTLPLYLSTLNSYKRAIIWRSDDIFTLWPWPSTLNLERVTCFKLWTKYDRNITIRGEYWWFKKCMALVTSRCEFELWFLDVERLSYIEFHVVKLFNKLEQNRTISGWVWRCKIWKLTVILDFMVGGFYSLGVLRWHIMHPHARFERNQTLHGAVIAI